MISGILAIRNEENSRVAVSVTLNMTGRFGNSSPTKLKVDDNAVAIALLMVPAKLSAPENIVPVILAMVPANGTADARLVTVLLNRLPAKLSAVDSDLDARFWIAPEKFKVAVNNDWYVIFPNVTVPMNETVDASAFRVDLVRFPTNDRVPVSDLGILLSVAPTNVSVEDKRWTVSRLAAPLKSRVAESAWKKCPEEALLRSPMKLNTLLM